jgi:uncharacterized protein YtpQ (UPF0354 family)
MPTIYPLLKPHDWPHQQMVAHKRLSDTAPEVPIVAFGFDTGDNYQFVPANSVDDIEALYREALGNLAALDCRWELGGSGGLRFATSSGNEFSAERLLDKQAMVECQRLLEAERIIVAAPRRTCLFATRDGLPDEQLNIFVQMVLHTYHDDSYGHAAISPAMFVIEAGVIKSVMIPTEEPAAPPPPAPSEKPWWKLWG